LEFLKLSNSLSSMPAAFRIGFSVLHKLFPARFRGKLRRAEPGEDADAGDIMLLFADESEALTHPYLACAWARQGAHLRVAARLGGPRRLR
jgi:hypothetical protein